jgi:hypothetical protein
MASKPIDPNDIEALQRQIAELQAQLSAAQQADTTIATQGGAAVQGGIRVGNGHFIGRDFIQTVRSCFKTHHASRFNSR